MPADGRPQETIGKTATGPDSHSLLKHSDAWPGWRREGEGAHQDKPRGLRMLHPADPLVLACPLVGGGGADRGVLRAPGSSTRPRWRPGGRLTRAATPPPPIRSPTATRRCCSASSTTSSAG